MSLKSYPEPVHFCWVCDIELAGDQFSATHYLDGRTIYFCCQDHMNLHADFASM